MSVTVNEKGLGLGVDPGQGSLTSMSCCTIHSPCFTRINGKMDFKRYEVEMVFEMELRTCKLSLRHKC